MDIVWVILIGLVAGALAGRVVGGHRYGVLGDMSRRGTAWGWFS